MALLVAVEDELAGALELAAGLVAGAADLGVLEEVRHVNLFAGPVAGAGAGAGAGGGAACFTTVQMHKGWRLLARSSAPVEWQTEPLSSVASRVAVGSRGWLFTRSPLPLV